MSQDDCIAVMKQGEKLTVTEIAKRTKQCYETTSKNLIAAYRMRKVRRELIPHSYRTLYSRED